MGPEVCYNMQYYNYCPRSDADCKFVHPKNRQRKQARRQITGNYYHNRYQEPNGYNNEDFFWIQSKAMEYGNANEERSEETEYVSSTVPTIPAHVPPCTSTPTPIPPHTPS